MLEYGLHYCKGIVVNLERYKDMFCRLKDGQTYHFEPLVPVNKEFAYNMEAKKTPFSFIAKSDLIFSNK